MKTKILSVKTRSAATKAVGYAAKVIRTGGVVIFPTETIYGIGADALNGEACERVYELKGREHDNPLLVHVNGIEMAEKIAYVPKKYRNAILKSWPGPITYILKARSVMPRETIAGLSTVAIRMPANKVALQLITESGVPIAAPSANLSKRPSATTAKHAFDYFKGKVEVILDGGKSQLGIESTILDLETFTIVRPGAFTSEQIQKIFKRKPIIDDTTRGIGTPSVALSPGTKYMHYAPSVPLFLFVGDADNISRILNDVNYRLAFIGSSESCMAIQNPKITKIDIGHRADLDQIAKNLFDALIRLESIDVGFAVIEAFPERGIGLGIMNRIRKASSHRIFRTEDQLNILRRITHLHTGSDL